MSILAGAIDYNNSALYYCIYLINRIQSATDAEMVCVCKCE